MPLPPMSGRVAPALSAALLRGSTDATDPELDEVAESVARSIAAMPDSLRVGVNTAVVAADLVLRILGRGDFRKQPAVRQTRLAEQLAGLPLPVVAELVRLTRGLGLVSLYESRTPVEAAG